MVSRYIKRAQTRLCDGETRLAPGSENESTDVLFEKTRRERVRTLLLLLFLRSTPARSSSSQKFFLSREEEETLIRKKKNGEKTRAKKTASLSLSLFAEKPPKALSCIHSFVPKRVRTVAKSLETRWCGVCARNITKKNEHPKTKHR